MKPFLLALAALWLPPAVFSADLKGNWELEKCELAYTVVHPLHTVHGKSLSARGKGVCCGGGWQFLVAVPVKSFESGDNNRDLHMLQAVRAGTYPMVEVLAKVTGGLEPKVPKRLKVDALVKFAGKEITYKAVSLDVQEWKPEGVRLAGKLPLTLKDFGITPPSLLTIPIHDDIPVQLDMVWRHMGKKEAATTKKGE